MDFLCFPHELGGAYQLASKIRIEKTIWKKQNIQIFKKAIQGFSLNKFW